MQERVRGLLLLAAVGVALCVAPACGDDDTGTTTVQKPPTKRDAGSGTDTFDADVPWPRRDAGAPQIEPGAPEEGLAGNCAIDSNKIYTVAQRSDPFPSTPLTVDPATSGFALPYVGSGSCLDAIHWASLAGSASAGAPQTAIAFDACALVRDTVASPISKRWLLASIDNREAPYDIWVAPFTGVAAAAAQRISQNAHVETALTLSTLQNGSTVMLAYADQDPGDGQTLYATPLDSAGRPLGAAVEIEHSDSLYFAGLALKPLGELGAALGYVRYSLDYATSDIVFVALDTTGHVVRDPWLLASHAGPSPSVDIALDSAGGGIVYARAEASTGRQIWFQQIDNEGRAALERDGVMRAPAQRVVNAPDRGLDVAMTKLPAGYIMTYRALPTGSESRAKLRAYFLDRYGAVIGSSDISYTSSAGGRTAIQSATDGRAVASWNQVNDDGSSSLKMVRLPCLGQ